MSESPTAMVEAALADLPGPLTARVEEWWRDFRPRAEPLPPCAPALWRSLPEVWAGSEFVARCCLRDPALPARLCVNDALLHPEPDAALVDRIRSAFAAIDNEAQLGSALRKTRQQEMVRIAWRDLAGWAPLDEVVRSLSVLADVLVDIALEWLHRDLVARHGEPIGEQSGAPQRLVVIGMGKLGGEELNFSSDIDLVFAYTEEGETDGKHAITAHEFFAKLGRRLIAVLNDVTDEGFVFRVDMRLRPNGDAGPLALSFDAMEQYFQVHGREWERYAWIKARPVAGDTAQGAVLLDMLRPFIYRKYIDFGVVESIRSMKAMIEEELRRKGMENNIKLGPGGIREVEFIGQAFQLIRGGRDRELQERRILAVFRQLGARARLTERAVEELSSAYDFLRRAEHRLQMSRDEQTHQLPEDDVDRLRLAATMGFASWPEFEATLRRHMRRVHGHFEQVFVAPQGEQREGEGAEQGLVAVWLGAINNGPAHEVLAKAGYHDPPQVEGLLRGLREGAAFSGFSHQGRERVDRLVPLLLAAAGLTANPDETMARLVRLLESIGRRSAYFSLLVENPMALSQLVRLSAASPWIANWIAQHPIVLDELLNPSILYGEQLKADIRRELGERMRGIDARDLEAQMEALREFRNSRMLRVAAADIGPGLEPGQVGAALCAIADALVGEALRLAAAEMVHRHGRPACAYDGESLPPFAIIGYGKLGSLELGYTSDLDMIFISGDCDPGGYTDGARPVPNETFFARLGQRVVHILSTRMPGGILYEVDMRLRPSGESGPLVAGLAAFENYQRERAWVWEHQALVRARPVAGHPAVRARFSEVRKEVLCRERDPKALRAEVDAMRRKMREAQKPHAPGLFQLKHDPGGIVDIEFMIQYRVLQSAHDVPVLADYTDNLSLLRALADNGIIDADSAGILSDAYRHYLRLEYRAKLMDQEPLVDLSELGARPARVREIWAGIFGAAVNT